MENLLEVENLRVCYHTYQGDVQAVRGVRFRVQAGETVAIVGESGCGKSVCAKSLMRLIKTPGEIQAGSNIHFQGKDVLGLRKRELQALRGGGMSMVFQDALSSLNPTMRVGRQITETLMKHRHMRRKDADAQAVQILKSVGIPDAERRALQYPHEFSGGQRQRIMIGMAFACKPELLIADEPTTALDVTVQSQILKLLHSLQEESGTAILLITHDLGVVAGYAQRIYVMYAGTIVEEGESRDIFYHPKHPYTMALLKAVPHQENERKTDLYAIEGAPPDLIAPPKGCPFAARCEYCMAICQREAPPSTDFQDTHVASCWLHHPMAKNTWPNPFAGEDHRHD